MDYILAAYLRSYLFYNRNEPPQEIHIPMIPAIKNYQTGEMIPVKFVEYVPEEVSPREALELPEESESTEEGEVPTELARNLGEPSEVMAEEAEEQVLCEKCGKPETEYNKIMFLADGRAVHEDCYEEEE
jgi:hypothetical protein